MPIDIHDATRLKELQALPLDRKIAITQARIIEWFSFWERQVYLSFSGGKDSTVLLDLVKKLSLLLTLHLNFLLYLAIQVLNIRKFRSLQEVRTQRLLLLR